MGLIRSTYLNQIITNAWIYKIQLIIFLLSSCTTVDTQVENNHTKLINRYRLIELKGDAKQRGTQHGKLLKNEIQNIIQLWKNDLENQYHLNADTFIDKFLDQTDYLTAIQKWTPELLIELKYLASASEVEFNTLFAFQLIDEIWDYADDIKNHHCTSIGINRTVSNPVYIAQNVDVPEFYQGYQVVFHLMEGDLESYIFSVCGFIGFNGVNNKAIGMALNSLVPILNSNKSGLPVAFLSRKILAAKSYEEAINLISTIPHASGQNYILGSLHNMVSLECSANEVTSFFPDGIDDFTYHTNYPYVNEDFSKNFEARIQQKFGVGPMDFDYKSDRFKSLEIQMPFEQDQYSREQLKTILQSKKSETDPILNSRTLATTIVTLEEKPSMLVIIYTSEKDTLMRLNF